MTVYNNDGQEFALKLFIPDDDENNDNLSSLPLELGALREISCLRLLRESSPQAHHIVCLHDIQPEWSDDETGGAGTAACLGMALPLYRDGSLADALDRNVLQAYSKRVKVHLAHDLLSAVTFLHDNGILHRDIKSDNVLLLQRRGDLLFSAVLIDFSLAKPIDGTIFGWSRGFGNDDQDEPTRHTGEIGTLMYNSPEVLNQQPYGKPADMWSVGVILLELLLGSSLPSANKPKQVLAAIQAALERLPSEQPFPELVRGLLQTDPTQRLSARQAVEHELFAKFHLPVPPVQHVSVAQALPYDVMPEEEENAPPTTNSHHHQQQQQKKLQQQRRKRRLVTIDRFCSKLGSQNPMTRLSALEYSQQFEQLEDNMDNCIASQSLLDCVVLAHRFWEVDALDLHELPDVFPNWDLETYVDNEATLFMIMDYCLYPRRPSIDE